MIKYFWLEKGSPLKEKMIISLDYYNYEHKVARIGIAIFLIVAVAMLALAFAYGK